ncbi:MAG: hypothetical protein U1E45_11725 [Geminicoccaceae bacterium]
MDAFVQLALIEKAKRVFALDPGVMLSFPLLSPVSFTPAELAALAAPATAADYASAADFARIVNFLPRDMVASASERMLWDVYRDVLTRAVVAAGDSVPADDPATAILYAVASDGTRTDSEALKSYRQYRDAWFVAREDYAAHKLTGELSEDPAVRQRWTEIDEPALRAALDAATTAWETLGNRAAIEAALQAARNAALRDPRRRWADWSAGFNPDVDLLVDANGVPYAPTGLSPRNFVEEGDWLGFDLSAGEVQALVDAAPAALKAVLDGGDRRSIERVSFQYRSVALVRPWLQPDMLTSRIWRSDDPQLVLSDGGEPPQGTCPAYATACVFVRNVQVVEPAGGGAPSRQDLRFTLDARRLSVRDDLRVDPAITARIARNSIPTVVDSPPILVQPPPAFRALQRDSFTVAPTALEQARLVSATGRVSAATRLQAGMAVEDDVLVGTATHRWQRRRWPTQVPPPPPSTTPPSPALPEQLSILAFVCRRLPKTPDPAPDLHW